MAPLLRRFNYSTIILLVVQCFQCSIHIHHHQKSHESTFPQETLFLPFNSNLLLLMQLAVLLISMGMFCFLRYTFASSDTPLSEGSVRGLKPWETLQYVPRNKDALRKEFGSS